MVSEFCRLCGLYEIPRFCSPSRSSGEVHPSFHQSTISVFHCNFSERNIAKLSPSMYSFDDELLYSELSAALGHEQIDLEPFGLELMAERLTAEGSGRME